MPETPIAKIILDEARGAHLTSKEILDLMLEPADDPILAILKALQEIQGQQRSILTKLDIIERRLDSVG